MADQLSEILAVFVMNELARQIAYADFATSPRSVTYVSPPQIAKLIQENSMWESDEGQRIRPVDGGEVHLGLEHLKSLNWLEVLEHPLTQPRIALNEDGEAAFHSSNPLLASLSFFHKLEEDWLLEALKSARKLNKEDEDEDGETFGFTPESSGFDQAPFQREKNVPASDRRVAKSDNQAGFAELLEHLDKIRDEFANDHKNNELGGEAGQQLLAEIAATKAQIESGWIRLRQLTEGLTPALIVAAGTYPGISQLVKDAISTIEKILQAFGNG